MALRRGISQFVSTRYKQTLSQYLLQCSHVQRTGVRCLTSAASSEQVERSAKQGEEIVNLRFNSEEASHRLASGYETIHNTEYAPKWFYDEFVKRRDQRHPSKVFQIASTTASGDISNSNDSIVPDIWLRDHCQCSSCVDPTTKQRLVNVFEIESVRIKEAKLDGSVLDVLWSDNHRSEYPLSWLERAFSPHKFAGERDGHVRPIWWGESDKQANPPSVEFDEVMKTEQGLAKWTRIIQELGFCFVSGCPSNPEATEKLLERIGPIRNTHYGGAFWDFTADLASKDTAYTNQGLDVHTDTAYFTEPAALQMFHLLSHDGTGGETQLVDGFKAAEILTNESKEHADILSSFGITHHASGNEGISIQDLAGAKTIHHAKDQGIFQVQWNNYDRATITPPDGRNVQEWYQAAKHWNEIIHRNEKDLRYEFALKPGTPLIFNNWRVLHGRSAFTGNRRMCGGYISRDDFISTYKISNFGEEYVKTMGII